MHVSEPESTPHDAHAAERVEDPLPVEHVADNSAGAESNHGADVRAGQGERGERAALCRRRPLRPQAMHGGKDEALRQALNNAQDDEHARADLGRQRHDQAEHGAYADAEAKAQLSAVLGRYESYGQRDNELMKE